MRSWGWVVVAAGVAGCPHVNPRAVEIAELSGDPAAGEGAYTAECAECHGADGRGTPRALHGDEPVNLTTASHWYSAPVFLTWIVEGIEGTDMPSFASWDDQALADVYAYVLSLPPG